MAATGLRQAHQGPMNSITPTSTYVGNLPHPGLGGNCLVLCLEGNSTDLINSVKDDKNNTSWIQANTQTSGQSGHIWIANNILAGTKRITTVINSADQFVQPFFAEFSGISTSANTLKSSTSATGITVTTISTTALTNSIGDLLFQFCYDQNTAGGFTFSSGTGWTLISAQKLTGYATQFKVATANNEVPSMSRSAGVGTYNTMAIALKADTSQGDATTTAPFTRFVQHHYASTGLGPSFQLQFPSYGDCVYADLWQGNNANRVSTVIDSINGTWPAKIISTTVTNGNLEAWSVGHCSTNANMTTQVTFVSSIGVAQSGMMIFKDIVGTSTTAIGPSTTKTGNQTVAVAPFNLTTVAYTPSTTNSAIMSAVIINSHTIADLNGGASFIAHLFTSPDFDGSDQDLDDCDGSGMWLNGNSVSASTFTWATFNSSTGGVGTWATTVVEILSASSSAPASASRISFPYQFSVSDGGVFSNNRLAFESLC